MNLEDRAMRALDREDRRRTLWDRWLAGFILAIGIVLAVLIRFEIASEGQDIHSITCEEGNVTLILEHSDGTFERVECPVEVPVVP